MIRRLLVVGLISCLVLLVTAPVFAQTREGNRLEGQSRPEAVRRSAAERVEKIRAEVKERRAQVNKDVCERRQNQIQAVIPRLATSAKTLLTRMSRIYSRVQGFYESGQLTVANYDELKTAVDAAKADAEDAVGAVASFSFVLDCDNQSIGEQLDGYRTVIKEAKAALKDYRSALVGLISALRAAHADDGSNSESQTGEAEETETE